MFKRVYKHQKLIAAFFLAVFATSLVPSNAWALTSGPEQPESKGFQPIGISNMVDLFSGDFHYSLPLLDVNGYAVNLTYNSGQSMDDEGSWVGYGWSLSPGAINRQLRGLPDDFNGTGPGGDEIEKQTATKPMIIKSISPTFALKRKSRKAFPLKFNVTFSHSNYTGVKAELGVNTSLSLTKNSANPSTLNLGIQSDNQSGGTFQASVNFPVLHKSMRKREFDMKGSIGFNYNATKGLEGLTLGTSFNNTEYIRKKPYNLDLGGNEFISFAGNAYIPSVEVPQRTKDFTFTLRAGGSLFGFSGTVGFKGTYSKQDVSPEARIKYYPAFGLLNAHAGKANAGGLMDFNRENEHPYHKKMPYLPVPVVNHDLYALSTQASSGQYKVGLSSSGILAENTQMSKSTKLGLGVELAFGNIFKIGIPDLSYQQTRSESGKWNNRNDYRTNGDFINTSASNPGIAEAYFKKVGEPALNDQVFADRIGNKDAVAVALKSDFAAKTFGRGTALNKLKSKRGVEYTNPLQKSSGDKRDDNFSYLTAGEAQQYGLEKNIPSYPLNSVVIKGCNDGLVANLPRESGSLGKKKHHISEITVTNPDGTRQVFGTPTYSIRQDEVSFSVKNNENARMRGLIQHAPLEDSVPSDGDARLSSKDYLYNFSKQRMRGYATSYLITGILSPDYVDVTQNGISDDDLGSAVKFNYTKLGDYKWRTPFYDSSGVKERVANYSEGFLSNKKDDKASYVYGEKEQWYLHSIESKTMLAMFILEDRLDGLGVNNSDGSLNSSFKLKRLKEIRLYSKAELYKWKDNLALAVPVKTVHFGYAYELFSGIPNSIAPGQGKLTLKSVSVTYGKNNQGKLHPYEFSYNIPAVQHYQFRQYDRWGVYKPADSANLYGLNNAEFPYSTQDKTKADRWAGYWQLSEIKLPSGGSIKVNYESDDYAYVQDKRASTMCFIKGIGAIGQNDNIKDQRDFFIELPKPVTSLEDMRAKYFEGMDNMYFKCFVDMDNKNTNYEYIPGYAKIESLEMVNSTTAKVRVKKVDGYNPVSKAGWQILLNSLPKLAYSEYDNLDSDDSDFVKAIRALVSAISRIPDIVSSFDARANRKKFANRINLNKSWVRLCAPDHKKLGGGSRVKRIIMFDKWSEMTGNANTESASYGQVYEYTTERSLTTGQKLTISSGVASYEPQIGGDENPFKQPVNVTQNKFLGVDEHYYVELPMGESYFPAPTVGYSKVVVKGIGADNTEGNLGATTTEFFTAKDFPTRVEATDLQRVQPALRKIFRLFSVKLSDHATVSQGYLVENYNMHGKQKAERIVDKGGQELSAVFYEYRTENKNSPRTTLNNVVPVIHKNGFIGQALLGVDYDFYTDMSEAVTENVGVNAEPGVGLYFAGIIPRPWFYFGGISPNYDKRLFRSAVAIKAINSFPILSKTIKVQNGSRIESENVLWDGETGDVLMTKTQNEFDDPVYSFTYPAHWSYDGMGPASKNQGLYFASFSTDANGAVLNSSYNALLAPGDELIQVTKLPTDEVKKHWVIKGTDGVLRTVDENGIITQISNKNVKILRSGRRNLSSTPVGTIVSLKNPIAGNKLRADYVTQVLDAKAVAFNEEWAMPVKLRCIGGTCPPGYTYSPGGFCYTGPITNPSNCGTFSLCFRPYVEYGSDGGRMYDAGYSTTGSGTFTSFGTTATIWTNTLPKNTSKGALNRTGVWSCSSNPTGVWIGRSVKVTVPETKTYYLGIGADNYVRFKVDGQVRVQFNNPGPAGYLSGNFRFWHVYPIDLTAGVHFIEASGLNDGSEAAFGCELYNNTRQQIIDATSLAQLNILVSSASFGSTNVYDNGSCRTCPVGSSFNTDDSKCYTVASSNPDANVFNPYRNNILGNWKQSKEFQFDMWRLSIPGDASVLGSTNIRRAGHYTTFSPYWASNGTNFSPYTAGGWFNKWVWNNESTGYNMKGMDVENKDALGLYSSVQAGYLQSLPVAIAANSRLRDLAYDGFEDYALSMQCSTDTCNIYPGHFNFQKIINNNTIKLDTLNAHSGRYSLKLSASAALSRSIYPMNDNLYTRDLKHQFNLNSNYPMKGFSPVPGNKYVMSFWVKDNNPTSANPGVDITAGGTMFWSFNMKVPVVEGWKRVEIVFDHLSATSFDFTIQPSGGTVYIDDIRIYPINAHVKSYVYDPVTLKLVAELDENNFASFFEYNDEGMMIRAKKETEKGIVTLRETRTGYRKN